MKFPKIKNPFKKRGDKVAKQTPEQKLKDFQDKLQSALQNWEISKFDSLEWNYRGTHEVYPNVNSTAGKAGKAANNVINICYEFIESQIDPSIPQPSVVSKLDGFDEQAQMIEDSLKNDLLESDINEINDENERNTPVCGHSVICVDWDSDYKHPLYRGKVVLRGIHPKQLVPQSNVWAVQTMDRLFVLSSVTRAYCKQRYDVEIPDDGEEYPEVNSLDNTGYSTGNEKDKVTEVVCWYRDKDGEVGRFVWANETTLENMPKYYWRRLEVCKECGGAKDLDGKCIECGGTSFKSEMKNTEILAEDVTLPPKDKDSKPVVIPKGTEIPYYIPKRYPVIVRRNVPKNFTFGGQSDIEIIKDQADAIKKVVSNIEDKIIMGGAIIKALDDHAFNLTTELYKIVRGTQSQLNALGVLNLTADIQAEMAFAQEQYQSAKNVLGITDSFQGQPDSTAESGRAKQIQVQQAAGRLQSKTNNKHTAFREMFECMFEMKLAFCDEPRPYVRQKEDGTKEYGMFDKHAFLVQDASGEWYYNTDFLFDADAGAGLPKDKMFLLDKAEKFLGVHAFDTNPANVRFWTILDQIHFPGAGDIKSQMQAEIEEAQAQQEQQAAQAKAQQQQAQQPQQGQGQQGGQISPEMQQVFQVLPPDIQQQVLQMPPDKQVAFLSQPPEQIAAQVKQAQGQGQPMQGGM